MAYDRWRPTWPPGSRRKRATTANLFLYDRVADTTQLVSVGVNGQSSSGECWGPMVGPDGKVVLFQTMAGNMVASDANDMTDAFASRNMASAAGPYVTSQSPGLPAKAPCPA